MIISTMHAQSQANDKLPQTIHMTTE